MKLLKELPQWLIWGLALPLVILNGWLLLQVFQYFQSLVTIFIGATVLSFILNYPIKWLQQQNMSRTSATILVFLVALASFLLVGVTIVPIVFEQLSDLVNRLPVLLESGNQQLSAAQHWALARRLPLDLNRLPVQLQDNLSNQLQAFSSGVLTVGLGLLGSAFNTTLIIVVTFYMLLHGDRLWDGLFQWLPTPLSRRLRRSLHKNFHNYFVGQATLASMMALSITVAFLTLKVPFGLLFGLVIGFMTLFPFGAALSIWLVSFLVALTSFWLGIKVLVVALIIDQSIESGIAPRILGRFTGLNPVWVLVALLIGARIGGLLGLLIAVPTAGFTKDIIGTLQTQLKMERKAYQD